jgi:hypothetical protein
MYMSVARSTTLRVADANDQFFPEGGMLFQYEGTFMFDAVIPDLPTDLPKGQVIVRGVALFDGNFEALKPLTLDGNFEALKPLTLAIVGGTGAYDGASGEVNSIWGRRQYPHAQNRALTRPASISQVWRWAAASRTKPAAPLLDQLPS